MAKLNAESGNQLYLEQLYLYGLNARFTRKLMSTYSAEQALELSKKYLEDIGLSGYIRLLRGDARNAVKFGQQISRVSLKEIFSGNFCMKENEKICIEDDFIIIKTPLTFLFICRKNLNNLSVDKLQDVLAIFIDTVDTWLDDHIIRYELSNTLQCSMIELIEESAELLNYHHTASDELLSDIDALFPTLGLQQDQEDIILQTIKSALNKHMHQIGKQIQKNNALGETLLNSVDALNHSNPNMEFGPSSNNDNCVELF